MDIIGVDFGGTRLRAALVDPQGRVSGFVERPTDAHRSPERVLDDLAALVASVESATGRSGVAVGIGIPTTVDGQGGLVACPNLPTFPAGFPLADALAARWGRRPWLDNDARCFTAGEARHGGGVGRGSFVGLTLGTSVGLGVALGGRLWAGAHGEAGEIWRSPVRLDAGGPNLHDALSAEALARSAGVDAGGAFAAAKRARAGDARALAAWQGYGDLLGAGLRWVCDVLDPELVVVGGSIAGAWDLFGAAVERSLAPRRTRTQRSTLGDHAALLGAAVLARESQGGAP